MLKYCDIKVTIKELLYLTDQFSPNLNILGTKQLNFLGGGFFKYSDFETMSSHLETMSSHLEITDSITDIIVFLYQLNRFQYDLAKGSYNCCNP